ncbi:cobalamin-independent methionine synthase catalytic subunit [Propionicimonas paludicola]|uniref:Cobalamin-independent methionine synthase catalytic subunit n=1 Tax=Propionicimonas paludicola TaxID=185243 RepID=A0A2A9CQS6_9ACTN|nr:methionine synthase [Propionicimonas paludicola]PFG16784.1 cobalamin-independent methionine synthase catalytic subunit [Propionicimonas paludicola]
MVAVTGLGSLPGTDFGAALRLVVDKLPDFAHLPELPDRGPWASFTGRGLGLPSGLPAQLLAGEWLLADAAGVDQRRARSTWRDDLDRLEEELFDYSGRFKVAVAGPWSLAATTGITNAGRVLADAGARRDLAQALAGSTAELLVDIGRRLPGAELVLQIDEPALPAVAAGAVPTAGGFFRHRRIDLPELAEGIQAVTAAAFDTGRVAEVVLHSCAPWSGPGTAWPLRGLRGVGASSPLLGFSFDLDQLATADIDAIAELAEAGGAIYLGVLPTATPVVVRSDDLRRRALRFLDRVGGVPAGQLVLTPACGLAGWPAALVPSALTELAAAGRQLEEELAR